MNYGRRSMDLWTGSWMIREFDRWTDIYNIDFDKLSGSLWPRRTFLCPIVTRCHMYAHTRSKALERERERLTYAWIDVNVLKAMFRHTKSILHTLVCSDDLHISSLQFTWSWRFITPSDCLKLLNPGAFFVAVTGRRWSQVSWRCLGPRWSCAQTNVRWAWKCDSSLSLILIPESPTHFYRYIYCISSYIYSII